MRAIVINSYGGPDVLEERDVETPLLGPSQIQVKVEACGLNPVDTKIRQGSLKDLFPVQFPRILGGDISGTVTELGQDSRDFKVGDEVFFSMPLDQNGGYAEYAVVDESIVARKPPTLSHIEAASLPVVGLTSIQGLRDFSEGKVGAGSRVLIHAGAGGVGSFAIQYAKFLGAQVWTTASPAKAEYVRSLGADHVIDYTREDFVKVCENAGGMDFVFETLGGLSYPKSILATRRGGAVPCIVSPPDADTKSLAEDKNVKTDFLLLSGNRNDLEEISRLVESGAVKPTVSAVIERSAIRESHLRLESGRVRGKLVLKP